MPNVNPAPRLNAGAPLLTAAVCPLVAATQMVPMIVFRIWMAM
jgi:hypothetical protein